MKYPPKGAQIDFSATLVLEIPQPPNASNVPKLSEFNQLHQRPLKIPYKKMFSSSGAEVYNTERLPLVL